MKEIGRTWFVLVLSSLALTLAGFGILSQMPAGLIPDDGYFYSKIALNIANHGFSSFDGIHPTDGYHQLWEYLLAGIAYVAGFLTRSKTVLLASFIWVDLLLMTAAAYFGGRDWVGRAFIFLGLCGCEFLMEGHLYAFLLAMGAWAYFKEENDSKGLRWATVPFALIPLTRIDTSLVPLAIGVFLFAFGRKGAGRQIVALTVLGILAHFSLMVLLHGHLMSVSSEIKADGVRGLQRLIQNLGQRTPTLPIPIEPQATFALGLGMIAALSAFRTQDPQRRPFLLGLWAGTATFTCAHLLLSETHPWYFAPAYVGFPITIIWSLPVPSAKVLYPCCAACGLLVAGFFAKAWKFRSEAPLVQAFVEDVNRQTNSQTRIYMTDGSGYLGYFLNAHVINGDGLVNSHQYAKDLRAGRLGGYLHANQVEFVMTNKQLEGKEPLIQMGGLVVKFEEVDPFLLKAGNGNYFFTNFALWKLPNPSVSSRLSASVEKHVVSHYK